MPSHLTPIESPFRLSITFTPRSHPESSGYGWTPHLTVDQKRRVNLHLTRLRIERGRGRDCERGVIDQVELNVREGVEVQGTSLMSTANMEGGTIKVEQEQEQEQEREDETSVNRTRPFVPSRRKARSVPFPRSPFEIRVGRRLLPPTRSDHTPVSSSSSSSSTSTSTSTSPDQTKDVHTPNKGEEDPYALILRGCLDGRWRGEGNYRCTRLWPGREGSSASHAGTTAHAQTSRSSHASNKKSTTPSHSARTRPKRGASSTMKPSLVVPGLTTGPSPSPLRMAYSQPNSPQEGVSVQSLSTLDVSRVIRASSESRSVGGDPAGGGSRKRRRGSVMEDSAGRSDHTEPSETRSDVRSMSSPPAKKWARSGLSVPAASGSGVIGVRVSPRLSHAVPVIPNESKISSHVDGRQDEFKSKSKSKSKSEDEMEDPVTPSGKRYTELFEQDKEAFRSTWPLEPISTEEWNVRTNDRWTTMSDAEKTAMKETTDQDRRRRIFAHLDHHYQDGKRSLTTSGTSLAVSQQTSGTSSDLGKALLKREIEAKKRREGRAVTYSPPPGVAGDDGKTGELSEPDASASQDGKRTPVGGTSMRRTLSHDTATLSRPRAPSRRPSNEVEVPVSMASSRSRREVGPPRHLKDHETEIVV